MMRKRVRRSTCFLWFFTALTLIAVTDATARPRKHKRAKTEATEKEVQLTAITDSTLLIDRVEGSTVHFKTTDGSTPPKPLALDPLSEIQPVGILRAVQGGQPYHLVRARPCKDCRQDPGIFAVQAAGGRPARFVEPGRILDNRSKATVMESRAFYGRCLTSRKGDVYVVFQKERVDRRRQPQQSVLVVEPAVDTIENGKIFDHLRETLIERRPPSITTTLRLVKSKACREVNGRSRVMATRPPDVNLKRQKAVEEDNDDEAETPRENQSDRDYDGAVPASD